MAEIASLTAGTMAGTGSFRCQSCGYVVTLRAGDALPPCNGCGATNFTRASLFSGARFQRSLRPEPEAREQPRELLGRAEEELDGAGHYLVFTVDDEAHAIALNREWTRIGRSLAADVRFDDPTVSRRHALIVRQPDGVKVLDDRSLNGIFVNDERVEWKTLTDGDEIVVGRYRLHFVEVTKADLAQAGLAQTV